MAKIVFCSWKLALFNYAIFIHIFVISMKINKKCYFWSLLHLLVVCINVYMYIFQSKTLYKYLYPLNIIFLYWRSTLNQKLQNNYILLSSCIFTQILLLDITEDEITTNPLQISSTFLGTFLIIMYHTITCSH